MATVNRALDHLEGPVVLAGHSYGGGVISEAGNHPKVAKLVYIAALAPQPEEPLGAILGRNPPAAQVEMQPDAHGFIWAPPNSFEMPLPTTSIAASCISPSPCRNHSRRRYLTPWSRILPGNPDQAGT